MDDSYTEAPVDEQWDYHPLATPVPITDQEWPIGTRPLVSICCITYNHVNFIRDAIQGFLMQETTFPVEILIHDDASTDGTAEVVREYKEKFPELIYAIIQKNNQYSRNIKPNSAFNLPRSAGKYIALCEGDDYWRDPEKIEKQASFLEFNVDYSVTYHDIDILTETGELIRKSDQKAFWKRDMSAEEIASGYAFMPTLTRVFRNNLSEEVLTSLTIAPHGDRVLQALLGLKGHGKYFADIKPAVYRKHQGGVFSGASSATRKINTMLTYLCIARYMREVGRNHQARSWERKAVRVSLRMIPKKDLIVIWFLEMLRTFRKIVN